MIGVWGESRMMGRLTRAGAVLSLCAACWGQQEDITSIRLLAERLHRAYEAKDLTTIDELWSEHSQEKASHLQITKKLLTDSSILTIKESTAGDPEVADAHARLRVDREIAAAPNTTPASAGSTRLVLEWVKEPSGWKIAKEIRASQDLAARLASSPSEQRDKLLAANQDLADAELAAALVDQGMSARNRGDIKTAQSVLDTALSVGERTGSAAARASALNGLGLLYADQGDYPHALESYRTSLDLSQQARDDSGASRVYTNLSSMYSAIGDLTAASEYLDKSLAIAQKLRDTRLTSTALGSQGVLYARRGDYLRAMSLLQQCQDLLKDGSDRRSLAATFNNIGNVYLWQGDLDQSQENFQRELDVATQAGLKPLIAVAWMGLGRVSEFRGELRAAIANYEKSLAVLNETGNRPFAASDLTFIGSAYSMLGDQAKSIEYFQKGLELQKAINLGSEAALTMGRIAEVYNRKADFPKALETANQARDMGTTAGMREAAWRGDLQAGRAQQGLGDNAHAEERFREAIAAIEDLRRGVAGAEAEQENFFETKLEPYHRIVGLLIAAGRNAEAFEYAERAKARVLTDVLRNGRAEFARLMSPEESARDQNLRMRMASLNTQLMRARYGGPAANVSRVTAELSQARSDYESFQNELFVKHPQWKPAADTVEPVRLEQAVALAGPKTAYLEFVVAEDRVYGFALQPGRPPKGFSVGMSRETLTRQVELFQRQMAARDLGFRSTAAALYQKLVEPAGLSFASTTRLVIVPDGVLWDLPFQALADGQGHYLLDDCAVSYAPSLTALRIMIDIRQQRRSAPAHTQLLAMGDPLLERRLAGNIKDLYRGEALADLPASKTEVQSLGRIYGDGSHVYVGSDARESRFKAEAGDARVLHLATHAVLNNASPLYSYLLLASEPGEAEDGLLEARELLTMNLHAELVVLSACETARGHVGAGEGMIGLSWALLVSGVPSTVLSQWKVASESTGTFMVAFHQNRKKGLSDAEALRAAALSLRKNPAYAHPFYWAPFTLIGAGLN
jgi:CHAT domain-containing protein/Tfp pilus assembly protein PilF